ncbi:C3a anaphylatoxin chemotactic receptor-like [Xenopus laevis]|uniref:C3a anaphylatoxin chemotactic receptor-like n=1 Tax=Xenopus laevis TaxID=8355 RepID=A0A8J1LWY9_XENLA|nr:C3a anaphylatoxin chemotactic receptor-like [Xenopus laevis]
MEIMEVMEVPEEVCNYSPYSPEVLEAARYMSFVLITLSCILGLVGNAVVIAVTGFIRKRRNSQIWFLNLAVADFCFSLLLGIYAHYIFTENWKFGSYLCKISNYASMCNMYASVFIITALTIDRVLLVAKPIWHHKNFSVRFCCWICSAIWILTALVSLPVLLLSDEIQYGDKMHCRIVIAKPSYATHNIHKRDLNYNLEYMEGSGSVAIDNVSVFGILSSSPRMTAVFQTSSFSGLTILQSELIERLVPRAINLPLNTHLSASHNVLGAMSVNVTITTSCTVNLRELRDTAFSTGCIVIPCLILGYFIPLMVILVSNLIIAQQGGKSQSVKSSRLYRIIIMIVLFFFLTWTPLITAQIILLAALYIENVILMYKMYWVMPLVSSIAFSNSCINPIIYVLVGTQARKALYDFMRTRLSFFR